MILKCYNFFPSETNILYTVDWSHQILNAEVGPVH